MKFLLYSSFLVGFAAFIAADVSHLQLNNDYLPPVHHQHGVSHHQHHHHEPQQPQQPQEQQYYQSQYVEQAQEIPAAIGADTYTPEHLINKVFVDVPVPEAHETAYVQEPEQQEVQQVVEEVDNRVDAGQEVEYPAQQEEQTQYHESQYQANAEFGGLLSAPEAPASYEVQSHHHAAANSEIETQYASNGGYVY